MKKIVLLRTILIINLIIFIYALCANNLFELKIAEIWFFLALFLISIPLIVKSYLFYVDASLYIGSCLFFCAIIGFISRIFLIDFSVIYPLYIFSLGFASLMVFLNFRQNIHFILFAIISIEVIILYIRKAQLISSTAFYIVNIGYLIILFMMVMNRVSKTSRRVK